MPDLTARETARRIVARASVAPGSPAHDGAAAERALALLAVELTDWFGPFGAHALFARALAHARVEHPALGGVSVGTPAALHVVGLVDSSRVHGVAGATGAVELIAWIIDLLGRLVGDELATVLVRSGAHREPADELAPGAPEPVGGAEGTGAGGDTPGTTSDPTGDTTDD